MQFFIVKGQKQNTGNSDLGPRFLTGRIRIQRRFKAACKTDCIYILILTPGSILIGFSL